MVTKGAVGATVLQDNVHREKIAGAFALTEPFVHSDRQKRAFTLSQ